jgi:hypothetical protein
MLHPGFVRHFAPTLRLLCQEGHSFHLAFNSEKANAVNAEEGTRELREDNPRVTISVDAPRRADEWARFAHRIRQMRNYTMYFDRRYADTDRLRANVVREVDPRDRGVVELLAGTPGAKLAFDWLLHLAERSIPSDPRIEAFIAKHAPDLVLATPLVTFTSPQVDYVKSARALGIPSALCVASWDNLTNKGKMRELPDRVTVWNEAQAEEAATLHGMPRRRIVVTGAQSFDHWFDARPCRTREEFMRERDFEPSRDLILYLCSSTSISPNEIEFIRQWYEMVRNAREPRVARAAILVRPHPVNKQPWEQLDTLADFAVWPTNARGLFEPQGKCDYFDSIYHAAAVVGLNTSGQVEAGLIGKPVLTLLSEDIPYTLNGTVDTVHFQHLLGVNGGLLHVARSFEEHLQQLCRAIHGDPTMAERSRRFTEAFVRPHGLERAAGPILAGAIRSVGALKPSRRPLESAIVAPLVRRVLEPLARRENARRKPKSKPVPVYKADKRKSGDRV